MLKECYSTPMERKSNNICISWFALLTRSLCVALYEVYWKTNNIWHLRPFRTYYFCLSGYRSLYPLSKNTSTSFDQKLTSATLSFWSIQASWWNKVTAKLIKNKIHKNLKLISWNIYPSNNWFFYVLEKKIHYLEW